MRAASPLLFLVLITAARGQSALDGFDPNANGPVRVVVVQPDGKILLGGDFTSVLDVARNHIARLNPDGTLDVAFNPKASSSVVSIAVQADGKILVGGFFNGLNSVSGLSRNYIARLDATTGLADSFNPSANNIVYAIAVQADGKILAGGTFTTIGGSARNRIARLDAATGLVDSFNPNANGDVNSLTLQPDGKILVGGTFFGTNSIGGQTRNRIARLDATTGLADSFDPDSNNFVTSIAVQADGKIVVGGNFSSIGGQTRWRIARVDATTGLADSFDPHATNTTSPTANGTVQSVVVQADGKVLASGYFTGIGGQTRNRIARLDPVTGLADSFDPSADDAIYSVAVQADGKIVAGGFFTNIGGQSRNHIARLETDGRLDQTLDLGTDVFVQATAVQPDGKILIGGGFSWILGLPRHNIARLNSDGTVDQAFNPDSSDQVASIVVQADGKILVGGGFSHIGGQARLGFARLDPTNGLADSFDAHVGGGGVHSIVLQTDGKILTSGSFSSIGGQPRHNIARLDPTTGLADSFDPNANYHVDTIAVQADGKVLVGGWFEIIGGEPRSRMARLDPVSGAVDSFDPNALGLASFGVDTIVVQPDGKILVGGGFTGIGGRFCNYIGRLDPTTGLADSFDPNGGGPVYSIAWQADGKILTSGVFNRIGGQTRNRIARLDGTTGMADSFDPNVTSFNSIVHSIALQADGKILAGGDFTAIGGLTRTGFARLSNDSAATQELAVTRNAINWTLGGSSPRFTRVTFEYSTDNQNYIFLGNGTVSGSNWFLPGLNFSTGQNFYVRARGHYRSGYRNNSESITESVRNAFLAVPTGTPSPTPVPTLTVVPTPTATPTPAPTPTPVPSPTPPPTPTPNPGCTDDTWTATSTINAPASRSSHTAVWTGSEMIVWGGTPDGGLHFFNTGGRYNPSTDTWTATSTTNAPSARGGQTAIWTGSEMIVWGGSSGASGAPLNTGAKYNPSTDSWTPISTTNAPSARGVHTAVWTGSEMIVWGGYYSSALNTGGRYNPTTDTWIATNIYNAPARENHTAVWTGSEMIVWGGDNIVNKLDTGGRYNSGTDSWVATNIINRPTKRTSHTGVWTGSKMVVWGGWSGENLLNTGGIYDPGTNSWAASSVTGAPSTRYLHTAVWTGGEMIVWGGAGGPYLNTGGRYNPGTNNWTATSTINAPSGRDYFTTVWTGGEMIVWGGEAGNPSTNMNTGGRYCAQPPPATTPSPTPTLTPSPTPVPPTPSPTPTATATATPTVTATATASATATPTGTAAPTASVTATAIATATASATATAPVAPSPTSSPTPPATATATAVPTASATATVATTPPPSPTPSATSTPTVTATPTSTPTGTAAASAAATASATATVPPAATPSPTPIATPSAAPTPSPVSQAVNLSTRMRVQTGDNVGIGGFIITGTAPKHVLLRAIGPSLAQFGVPNVLADPVLELHGPGAFVTITNDNWRDEPAQEAAILATGIPPTNNFEAAIDVTLNPGAYTAVVKGNQDTSGVALFEIYDLNPGVSAQLANLSTRAFADAGDNMLIAGFMLGGNSGDDRIVVRGIGPSLIAVGISNALTDPTLELRDGNGALLASNDNWQDNPTQAAELTAAGLAPTNNLESGIAATLQPGLYTALLSGANNGTGVGLVEVYDRGAP
jgi:uncharacterized delta-60 repeat protein